MLLTELCEGASRNLLKRSFDIASWTILQN